MTASFSSGSVCRNDAVNPRQSLELPHGLVRPPAEIVAQVAKEQAKFSPEVYSEAYAKRILDDWTLAHFYAGLEVAYRSVGDGIEVLAVGPEEIGQFVKGMSQEELLTFTIKEP